MSPPPAGHPTLALLAGHRSSRDFADRPLAEADLAAVIAAAHRAPTSSNGQQVSLVVVRDPARRRALAAIAGGQDCIATAPVFVVVLVDYHKTAAACARHARPQQVEHELDGLLTGGVDAGIALASLMLAARALGLGVRAIGGIRNDCAAVAELLGLPPRTLPICGLCLGYESGTTAPKPRLPIATFRHDERYDAEALEAAITAYDAALAEYWRETGRASGRPWSEAMARTYSSPQCPGLAEALRRQGFTIAWPA